MKTVLVILGTRPEAIKMCQLIKEIKKNGSIKLKVLSTGQHQEMLDCVLEKENIEKDYDLSLMKIGQTLSYLTSEILIRTERIIDKHLPDFVLVHGDTTSAFAGALSAFYKNVPVGHVEAGLRTYDVLNPYPEEFNRCAISKMASYHFAPTESNKQNLIREGIDKDKIFVTGNTVIDALKNNLRDKYTHGDLPRESFIILTMHRRESIGKEMADVFSAVKRIADGENIKIVYPIHKNEKIIALANGILGGCENVKIIPALNPFDFHNFLARCRLVITDSGGIQEEASYLGKPLLITRKCTERRELLANPIAKLVGSNSDEIVFETKRLIEDDKYYNETATSSTVFGDGNASYRIASKLFEILNAV